MTRRSLIGSAIGAVAYSSALDGKPLPPAGAENAPRTRETFDFGWKFFKGDVPGAQMPGFSDSAWRSVDLPHDWSIEGPYSETAPTGGPGGYLPTGIGWYRKRFTTPAAHRREKVVIEFDGVYENSEVWINGSYLGKRPYGFISFAYDLTPHLHSGDNVLAVRVDNSLQPNSRFYSGSGIYRHTWLVRTNPIHIAQWGACVTTPHISAAEATIRVKTKVRNESSAAQICSLLSEILDRDNKTAGTAEAKQKIAPGD
ncbi:MAG: glycoside hydrolase family 2 protein [Bryobacteraceae bacterium]